MITFASQKVNNIFFHEMKKSFIACFFAIVVLSACSGSKRDGSMLSSILPTDSAQASSGDSLASSDEEVLMPSGADELFDDFFFNFASDQRRQRERVVFPLPVRDGEKERTIQRRQWKLELFFMKQDFYTLFFDSPEEMELVTDTTVVDVTVERFYLAKARVEQFLFSRKSGQWMLHEVRWQPLPHNANGQFFLFYQQFVGDSVFQYRSLAEQIEYSGPDPEDDFATIDGFITPDFWEAFRPDLPKDVIYNIVYGRQNPATTQKIMLLRGIDDGLEVEITFRLQRGHWKLTKLIT